MAVEGQSKDGRILSELTYDGLIWTRMMRWTEQFGTVWLRWESGENPPPGQDLAVKGEQVSISLLITLAGKFSSKACLSYSK